MKLLEFYERIIWRQIPSFPDYQASSIGTIRRVRDKSMVQSSECQGYRLVRVRNSHGGHSMGVHRLICEAFHGRRPTPHHECAHNDGVRNNNYPENLRWATRSENQLDRRLHGTNYPVGDEFDPELGVVYKINNKKNLSFYRD